MSLMDVKRAASTIDLQKRRFSLLLADPKASFIAWLDEFARTQGKDRYPYPIPQEENCVVVIPSADLFSRPNSLTEFIEALKPKILKVELARFRVTPRDLGRPMDGATFDHFFDIRLRDTTHFLTDFDW